MEYTWSIEDKDDAAKAMVVKYSYNGIDTLLNIPMAPAEEDVASWIQKCAPINSWRVSNAPVSPTEIGMTGGGIFNIENTNLPPSNIPSVGNNWDDERLRALIYEVLQEIKDSEV